MYLDIGVKIQQRFDFRRAVKEPLERLQSVTQEGLIEALTYIGEDLVKYARSNVGFISRTGNLLSSIGYVVVHNGAILQDGGFTRSDPKGKGIRAALSFFKAKQRFTSLIIVAGMEYAAFVEAKGYSVLIPAELRARRTFNRQLDLLLKRYLEKNKSNRTR